MSSRKSLSGASRLAKPNTTQLFESQRDAARAWRNKSLGGSSTTRLLFSPVKSLVEKEDEVYEKTDSEEALKDVHDEKVDVFSALDMLASAAEKKLDNVVEGLPTIEDAPSVVSSEPQSIPSIVLSPAGHGPFANKNTSIYSPIKSVTKELDSNSIEAEVTSPASVKSESTFSSILTKIIAFSGYSSLTWLEKWILLSVLITSPFWLFQVDQVLNNSGIGKSIITQLVSIDNQLSAWIQHIETTVSSLQAHQLVVIIVGGIVMSFVIDRDTRKSNAFVFTQWTLATERLGFTKRPSDDDKTQTSLVTTVLGNKRIFIVWFVGVLLFSVGLRFALTLTTVIVVKAVTPYLPSIIVALIGVIGLVGIVYYQLHRRKQHKERQAICEQLGVLTKKIVHLHGYTKPYPIEYVYEEVNDTLLRAKKNSGEDVVHSQAVLNGVGSPQPSSTSIVATAATAAAATATTPASASKPTVMHSIYNMLFSPSKSSTVITTSSVSNEEQRRLLNLQLTEIKSIASEITLSKGLTLQKVWKEVIVVVERDRRIQTVDLMVDGAQRKCWRLLSGNTNVMFSPSGK